MFRKINMLLLVLVLALGISLPAADALVININPGPGLAVNPTALASFNRAAGQWTKYFNDPISVNINADLQPLGPGILGSTSAVFLQGAYNTIRNQMVADALPYANNSIVGFLPTAAQFRAWVPNGFGISSFMEATKADLKAMGFTGLDGAFGANDANITFSTNFNFAYTHAGLAPGLYDFETVAAHEIGHVLGFISAVDVVDYYLALHQTATIAVEPLDLFRFRPADNPTNTAQFTLNNRSLLTGLFGPDYGQSDFSDTTNVYPFSTGYYTGDGRQASHWKDDSLTSTWIGLMDPTLASNLWFDVATADIRAMDLIGYDLAPAPLPGTLVLLGSSLISLVSWRRFRKS